MAHTRAHRKGGMVAHIMRNASVSVCGRVMAYVPGGEGLRLCKSCSRLTGIKDEMGEIEFPEIPGIEEIEYRDEWHRAHVLRFVREGGDAFTRTMCAEIMDMYRANPENWDMSKPSDRERMAMIYATYRLHIGGVARDPQDVVTPSVQRRQGDGMVNPNSKTVAKSIVTENQRRALNNQNRYMDSLIVQRMELEGKEIPADWGMGEELSEEWFSKLKTRADINKAFESFSKGIDALKESIAKLRANKPKSEVKTSDEIGDGYYVYGDTFACVKFNRAGTRQYATVWDKESESWEYDSRESAKVRAGILNGTVTRVTPEDAKRFGDLYGSCMKCSRTLTDAESIAAGIGPICAGKMGW